MSKIINYAGEDFDNEIVLQNGLTLVDFTHNFTPY